MLFALKAGLAEALGFVLLLPACLLRAWTAPNYTSIKPLAAQKRLMVDQWAWSWLRPWYANVEDGVSGQQAWVWGSTPDTLGKLVPYASLYPSWTPQWVIAYGWSAWRNGANNIKRPLRAGS